MMTEVLIAMLCVAAGLAWAELREWLPHIAKKIIISAVGRLEPTLRDRMREELIAEVALIPGKISPVVFACSIWVGFTRDRLTSWVMSNATSLALRFTDITIASILLLYILPVLGILYLTIRLSSRGPAVIPVKCLGIGREPFDLLILNAYSAGSRKMTEVGCIMYKLKMTELPMLWNVIRGDMSLVGPPPRSCDELERADWTLRPGVAWPTSDYPASVDGYGQSLAHSLKFYFNILGRSLKYLLTGKA